MNNFKKHCFFLIVSLFVITAFTQNPGGVTGTTHWYKADDVIASGASISQLNDLSGNNYHATQSDVTEQPSVVTGVINGNQVIRFDGTKDHLPIKDKFYTNVGEINALNTFVVYKTTYSGNWNNNWSFIDYDRSDFYNVYVRGDGKIGVSYKPSSGSIVDRTSTSSNHNIGIPRLASFSFDTSVVNDTKIGVNGKIELNQNIVGTGVGVGTSKTRYGFIGDGSEASGFNGNRNKKHYQGDIAEIIVFENNALSTLEINKIETYLGLKYGLHIDHDFISASAGTIWSKTINSEYHNLVTGIARDDASGLNQLKSVNQDGGKVTVEATSSLGNNDFLIWGENQEDFMNTTFNVPSSYSYRIEKTWKTEMNNTISNVAVSIDISELNLPIGYNASDISLVINTNDDFTGGASFVDASSFDGTIAVFNNVNFIDGGYFTICLKKVIVKDVFSAATFWLKADKDVYENTGANDPTEDGDGILRWLDQTSNGLNAVNAIGKPVYDDKESTLNFIADVDFSAGNHVFRISNSNLINLGDFNKKSLFTSFRSGSDVSSTQVIYEEGGTVNGLNIYISGGMLYASVWVEGGSSPWEYFLSTPISPNTEYVAGLVFDGKSTNTGAMQLYLNGELKVNQTSGVGILLSHSGSIGLGGIYGSTKLHTGDVSGNGRYFKGQLQEVIYFNEKAIDVYESKVVSSYLALRAGVTLIGDYLDTDYSTIWSSTINSMYHNGVLGVGRDDKSSLDQRKGKNEGNGEFVDLRHLSSFSIDKAYALAGHDNGVLAWTNSGSPSSSYDLIGRTWKVNLSGTGHSNFKISIDSLLIKAHDMCFSQYAVIVDSDTDFSSGGTIYLVSFDSETHHLTGNISLNDNDYFTIAVVRNITKQDGLFTTNATWLSNTPPKNGDGFIVNNGHELTVNQDIITGGIQLNDNSIINLTDKTIEITKETITKGSSTTINTGTSTVRYSKEGDQDVVGANYYNLLIKNNGTKTVIEPASVQNNLGLESTSSVLNANNNITLKSSSSNTARVLAIPTGAELNGNIHVQRWIGATARKWWHMGSPVQNATLEEWHDDIPITGDFATSDNVGGSDLASVKWYDETDPSSSSDDGWKPAPVNGFNEPIVVGRGYRVYIRKNRTDALNDTVISVTGKANQGPVTLEATYNGAGGAAAAGWCFVSNPYPSAIDWDNSGWTKKKVENAIYVWDALNSRYTSYVDGVGTNGGTSKIASSQGFWVRTTKASTQLKVTEPVKSTEEVYFFKANPNALYVNIEEGNYKSNTALRFGDEYSEAYDLDRDAYYLGGSYPVNIGTVNSNYDYFSVNSLPEFGNVEIPLYIKHKSDQNKEFVISFSGIEAIPSDSYLTLTDTYKNQTVIIDENTRYTFKYDGNSASNGAGRFVINKRENTVLANQEFSNVSKSYVYPTVITKGETLHLSQVTGDKVESLEILSLSGKLINKIEPKLELAFKPNLPQGCYVIRLTTIRGVSSYKIIVQ